MQNKSTALFLNDRAFTLIELLIIVAILGVLVTTGRGAYSRMKQKSNQAEAQVLLAQIVGAEKSFFSEFRTYGDQIQKIGFNVNVAPQFYSVGFATTAGSTCTQQRLMPGSTSTNGTRLATELTTYYTGAALSMIRPTNPPTTCDSGVISDAGNIFTASASAVISPSANPANAGEYDVWQMSNTGILQHTVDGVK